MFWRAIDASWILRNNFRNNRTTRPAAPIDGIDVRDRGRLDAQRQHRGHFRRGGERRVDGFKAKDDDREKERPSPLPTMAIGSGYGDRQGEPKCTASNMQ